MFIVGFIRWIGRGDMKHKVAAVDRLGPLIVGREVGDGES
jgi:hypothetical protein